MIMTQMAKRSFSIYLQQALKTIQTGAKPLVQILVGGQLCIILISLLCGQANPFNDTAAEHPFLYILWALGTMVISILMMTSTLFILRNAQQGHIPTWKEALQLAAGRFWPVLGASIIYMLLMWVIFFVFAAIALAVMVLIYTVWPAGNILFGLVASIAAIWLTVTCFLGLLFSVYYVAVDESRVFQALPSAIKLLKTSFWGTFALGIGGGLIAILVSTLIGIIQLFMMPLYMINPFLGLIGTWILSVPLAVINTTVLLGLAFELYSSTKRIQTEQLNQNEN